ncbi:MAG TPA: hypothetical protein VGM98_17965 [Schlesneria sp.]|jgi:hypothetical protein
MPRKHIVISGTGRTGTSFLVELLTHLGLDTGYQPEEIARHKSQKARAGLEHDIRHEGSPYIVKSPWFCDHATEVLDREDITIEHVFIPMRDLQAAAESRRFVTQETVSSFSLLKRIKFHFFPKTVAGGIWHTDDGRRQETVLLEQVYNLTLSLSNSRIPVTLLRYPLLVNDPSYLFDKLQPLLGDKNYIEFKSVFNRVANRDLVHSFSANDR